MIAGQGNLVITEPQERPLDIQYLDRLDRAEKPPMLIEGVLGRRAVHVWCGMPYAGKTFLAIEAMRAVAEAPSRAFLDRFKAAEPGNVLYLGNDSPDWDIRQQFDKVVGLPDRRDMAAAIAETSYGSYGFVFDSTFALSEASDALRLVEAANRFASYREAHSTHENKVSGTALIVVDTLRSVHGFEENDNTEMQHVVNLLRFIADSTGAAVLALHHFNKSHPGERNSITLERVRGAVAITGGVDSVLALGTGKDGVKAVHVLKHRVAPEQGDFMYNSLDSAHGRVVLSFHSDGVANPRVTDVILALLRDRNEWVKTRDIVAKVQFDLEGMKGRSAENAVNAVLRNLEKTGEVVRLHGAARLATKGVVR